MATLAQHLSARNDSDLLLRFVAAAEQSGIPNAQAWAESNLGKLISIKVDDSTIADVHAYAVAQFEKAQPTPRPGQDPTLVTDDQIRKAVQFVNEI